MHKAVTPTFFLYEKNAVSDPKINIRKEIFMM